MTPGRPGVVAVVGPTAAGKSALAVALAHVLDADVVNADSMQLYRGMDIGTAKPTPQEQEGVPHHLLDVWDVREPASVAAYQRLARSTLEELTSRGRWAVLVGGSGLYVRAAMDELDFPGTDAELRHELEEELARAGPARLHERLATLDPAAAEAILPTNGRRIVRAVEVVTLTGRPFAAALPQHRYARPSVPTLQVGLALPRPALDVRIEARVDRMWDRGLVPEVARLAEDGLREGRTASRALGYAQVLRALDGQTTLEAAREDTVRATRRFARRQESWFRRDPRVRWLAVDDPDLALAPARQALVGLTDLR